MTDLPTEEVKRRCMGHHQLHQWKLTCLGLVKMVGWSREEKPPPGWSEMENIPPGWSLVLPQGILEEAIPGVSVAGGSLKGGGSVGAQLGCREDRAVVDRRGRW